MNVYDKYLPPLISDYSALHLLFFDRSVTLILLSPGGCNHPTREVDEYRNFENTKQYTTKLNDAHITIGIENFITKNALENIDMDSDFFVILGTSITNIIGTNLMDISKKIERIMNKPVLYFNTSAFKSYSKILSEAYKKMYPYICKSQNDDNNKIKVNIIGYNSIVNGHEKFLEKILELLKHKEIELCLDGKNNIKNVDNKLSKDAKISLVLSEEGISLAEQLEKEFQVPYEKILPLLTKGVFDLYKIIEDYCGITYKITQQHKNREEIIIDNRKKILIIGEPFFILNLKKYLFLEFGISQISLMCLFKKRELIAKFTDEEYDQIKFTIDEKQVTNNLNLADVIIADPLIKEVFHQVYDKFFILLPFLGLSGREYADINYDYIGIEGFNYFKKELKRTGVVIENEKI